MRIEERGEALAGNVLQRCPHVDACTFAKHISLHCSHSHLYVRQCLPGVLPCPQVEANVTSAIDLSRVDNRELSPTNTLSAFSLVYRLCDSPPHVQPLPQEHCSSSTLWSTPSTPRVTASSVGAPLPSQTLPPSLACKCILPIADFCYSRKLILLNAHWTLRNGNVWPMQSQLSPLTSIHSLLLVVVKCTTTPRTVNFFNLSYPPVRLASSLWHFNLLACILFSSPLKDNEEVWSLQSQPSQLISSLCFPSVVLKCTTTPKTLSFIILPYPPARLTSSLRHPDFSAHISSSWHPVKLLANTSLSVPLKDNDMSHETILLPHCNFILTTIFHTIDPYQLIPQNQHNLFVSSVFPRPHISMPPLLPVHALTCSSLLFSWQTFLDTWYSPGPPFLTSMTASCFTPRPLLISNFYSTQPASLHSYPSVTAGHCQGSLLSSQQVSPPCHHAQFPCLTRYSQLLSAHVMTTHQQLLRAWPHMLSTKGLPRCSIRSGTGASMGISHVVQCSFSNHGFPWGVHVACVLFLSPHPLPFFDRPSAKLNAAEI